MANNNKIVKHWRGTRENYNSIVKSNTLDYWTRYSVKEVNGVWTEYYGSNQINTPSGSLLPVIDICETLPSILNPGDRYLIGKDATSTEPAEYYIITIDIDNTTENKLSFHSEPFINNSGMSVRVRNKYSMSYQLIDGKLITYDLIDCGTY
jgi:hypothetical protein